MLNCKITLPLPKLDIFSSRLVSNGLIFSDNIPFNNQLATLLLLFSIRADFCATLFVRLVSLSSVSICFVLFEVNYLLKVFSLSSKYLFSTKPSISALLAQFVCFNLTATFSADNLLNYLVVIYLLQ